MTSPQDVCDRQASQISRRWCYVGLAHRLIAAANAAPEAKRPGCPDQKQHRSAMRQFHEKAVMPGGVTRRLEHADALGDFLIARDRLKGRRIDFRGDG